ncbi:MAG: carboxypeptidase regulatory-like domain-containing protein [Candidatus Eisenbacteria bacterium]|nr:carboxypeptidase regulatory-like domain-containing protein [Candidatus Eisenbacteria bacterium]
MKKAYSLTSMAVLVAGVLFALAFLSCTKDPPSPVLNPPGKAFLTRFQTIQLTGSFKNWSLDVTSMSLVGDYVWEEKVSLTAGDIGFKFLIDGNGWADVFGKTNAEKTLAGPVERMGDVYGADLKATIPSSGVWVFRLYEDLLRYTITPSVSVTGAISGKLTFSHDGTAPFPKATLTAYKVTSQDTTTSAISESDTLTGDFALSGLSDGSYFVRIQAAAYRDTTIAGITVSGGGTTNIGTVALQRVAFVGGWQKLQLVGDFPQSNWTLAQSPYMALIADSTWSVTISLSASTIQFKFVPRGDGTWDPSYGTSSGQTGLTGPTSLVSGTGTHLTAAIPSTGNWKFVLHEKGYLGSSTQAWYEISPATVQVTEKGSAAGTSGADLRRARVPAKILERGKTR